MKVLFTKWYPTIPDSILGPSVQWSTVLDMPKWDVDNIIDRLVTVGYYVAQHKEKSGFVTVAIDTTWFRQR